MILFLGDIAFILETLVFGIGLVIWHWGSREKSKMLLFAGRVLAVVAVLTMICTSYYYVCYWQDGAFSHSSPMR